MVFTKTSGGLSIKEQKLPNDIYRVEPTVGKMAGAIYCERDMSCGERVARVLLRFKSSFIKYNLVE